MTLHFSDNATYVPEYLFKADCTSIPFDDDYITNTIRYACDFIISNIQQHVRVQDRGSKEGNESGYWHEFNMN